MEFLRQYRQLLRLRSVRRKLLDSLSDRSSTGRSVDRQDPRTTQRAFERFQRIDHLIRHLQSKVVLRVLLGFLLVLTIVFFLLIERRADETRFQVEGRFRSIMFRAAQDIRISRHGDARERTATFAVLDDAWSTRFDTPFSTRERSELQPAPNQAIELVELSVPRGSLIRLQEDGGALSLVFRPRVQASVSPVHLSLYMAQGTVNQPNDTTVRSDVFAQTNGSEDHVLQLSGYRLELPCMPIDSVVFANGDFADQGVPELSSVLEAEIVLPEAEGSGVTLLQRDTLALDLSRPATVCITADSSGIQVKLIGGAEALLAGNVDGFSGARDLRLNLWRKLWARTPAELRTFVLTMVLGLLAFVFLGQRHG